MIFITASLFVSRSMINSTSKRDILSNINRSIYAVESEIRYNKTFSETEESLKNDFYLNYNNNFIKNIKEEDILNMDKNYTKDKYLMLKIIEKSTTHIKVKVIVNYKDNHVEKEFDKEIWMDEV